MNVSLFHRGGGHAPGVPLGAILRAQGAIDDAGLDRGLVLQRRTGRRIGDVLRAEGLISAEQLLSALSEQTGIAMLDPDTMPRSPAASAAAGLRFCLRHRVLPWRRSGAALIWITPDPAEASLALTGRGGPEGTIHEIALVTEAVWEAALHEAHGPALAERAAFLVARECSARSLGPARAWLAAVLAAIALAVTLAPITTLGAIFAILIVVNGTTTLVRIAAMCLSGRQAPSAAAIPDSPTVVSLAERRTPPMVTLMVPLYREERMIPALVEALERIDYPRPLLDVMLLIEEPDTRTAEAARAADLPPWFRIVTVPAGRPRTKPRALNHALALARGEIVGILDAEDRPDPRQVRMAAETLSNGDPATACVQCELCWYNARENWLSRCFQIEYGIWFAVLMRGWRRLGLPIPLGGTSVYFRRSALDELGGWDAHNVTEDADLGMRLARAGYRTEVLAVATEEEAACRLLPWVRQRSRWLKGYLMTWLSHMRDPGALWRELGAAGFLGLNILFLGAATAYLALPLFWAATLQWWLTGQSVWAGAMPGWAVWPVAISLMAGQAAMLVSAVMASARRGQPWLALWVPTLPAYWTLGAVAAWKAVIELLAAPYYWDKTRHGVSRIAPPGE